MNANGKEVNCLEFGRILVKINRFSGWMLLIFMIIYLISGYAWYNGVLLSLRQARAMHTELDLILVFFFLVHALISIRFALIRWRVGHGQIVNLILLAIGVGFFCFVLSIR
jgi:succinate dehydrogenase/fumarate reductase cytochrome b subunit